MQQGGDSIEGDRAALEAIYEALHGDKWTRRDNWLSSKPLAEWEGVETDEEGRVIQLKLANNNMRGALCGHVGNLTRLQCLDLRLNKLGGVLPRELWHLTTLVHLNLSYNVLKGEICSDVRFLQRLESLELDHNQLEGRIPSAIGDLRKLVSLYLSMNKLTGTVPWQVGEIPALKILQVYGNRLIGPLAHHCDRIETSIDFQPARSFSSDFAAALSEIMAEGLGEHLDETDLKCSHEFEELEFLGEGSFGRVHKAKWGENFVAIKKFCIDNVNERGINKKLKDLKHEANVLKRVCHHPHIIRFYGVNFEDPSIVMEYVPKGSVEDFLVKGQTDVPLKLRLRILYEAVLGLRHLHLADVIHRDFAGRNLLLDEWLHVKVADFGFAAVKTWCGSRSVTQTTIGHVKWSAPEVLRYKHYGVESDVFSYGVVCFEVVLRCEPWKEFDNNEVLYLVNEGTRMPIPETAPELLVQLMQDCWSQEPSKRPSVENILLVLGQCDQDFEAGRLELHKLDPLDNAMDESKANAVLLAQKPTLPDQMVTSMGCAATRWQEPQHLSSPGSRVVGEDDFYSSRV